MDTPVGEEASLWRTGNLLTRSLYSLGSAGSVATGGFAPKVTGTRPSWVRKTTPAQTVGRRGSSTDGPWSSRVAVLPARVTCFALFPGRAGSTRESGKYKNLLLLGGKFFDVQI